MNGQGSNKTNSDVIGAVAGAANQNLNGLNSRTAAGDKNAGTATSTFSQTFTNIKSNNSLPVGGGKQKLEQLIEPIEKTIANTKENIEQLEEIKSTLD